MRRYRDDFVVGLAAIQHFQNAERTTVDLTAGKRRLVDAHENVERVAVFMERAWNEAVITWIMHGGKQNAIETKLSGSFVELVFIAASSRNLDHCSDALGRMRSDWEVVPRIHDGTRSIVPL